jgi:acyl carrier protein
MTDEKLNSADIADIEDLIPIIEESFGFKFEPAELEQTGTFGELCDIVLAKVQHLENSEDCTSQQAFYKLRDSIATVLQIDKSTISTDTSLHELFPILVRRQRIKKIERQLGFKLKLLRPTFFETVSLGIILLGSFIGLFFNWKIGLTGLLFSIAGLRISNYFGNTLDLQTVGQVANKMSTENYLKSRRNPLTANKKEIEQKIQELFADKLSLPKTAMSKDATFM